MTRKILSIILCLMLVLPAALPVHAAETLYHVDISIDAPKAWSAPCFYTNSVKNEYGNIGVAKVVSVAWYEYNPNRAMTASDTFQAGKIYEVTVRLEQVSGVLFAKNTFDELYMTANINGMTATVTPVYGNSHQADVSLRFPELGGYINNASVNDIDVPVTGNTPDYSGVLASTEYKFMPQNDNLFKNGIVWYDATAGQYVPTSHKFIAGHVYWVEIHLVPEAGKTFSDTAQGSVNNTSIGTVSGGGAEIALIYEFPACAQTGEMLTTVSVSDIEKPMADKTPDYTATLGSTKYKLKNENSSYFKNGIVWYDLTRSSYMKTTEKFQPDHEYVLEIVLVPASGYYFSGDVLATVNGMQIYASGGDREITITYTIGKCTYHTCKLTEVKEVAPTCTKDGKKAYYHCDECEKDFEDAMASLPIENLETWGILKGEHKWDENFSYSNKKGHAHSCLNEGCKEHDELQDHELENGKCTICDYGKEKTAAEEETEPTEETKGKSRRHSSNQEEGQDLTLVIIIGVAVVVLAGATALVIVLKKRGKKE